MAGTPSELIKEKLDVVEFLKGYLPLTPAGKNFKALCPFHKEKTPSFMVSPERQTWHCFGCNLGGDIFAFLMRYENLEFGEALRILAEKAGIELKRVSPAEYKYVGLLYDLNEAAKKFFQKRLEESLIAKKYLAERGLKKETIEEFEIGFAPNEPDTLTIHFLNAGNSPDDLLRAGLSFKTERGMQLDRFRGRIMFPIHNHVGKVVGFTGRILPQLETAEIGKYVNSPETPIFQKSKLLYGFFKTKNFIREAGSAFLVEGQMDFLMSWQAGVKNVIASSGTALTPDHLRVLRRLTDQLVLSFDSDAAGSEAGERAIDLAEANDFNVQVAAFAGYKDPAEAVQADPGSAAKAIQNAKPAPEFYFDKYLSKGGAERHGREYLKNLRAVLGKIKTIASPVERSFWFKELSRRVGVEEKTLIEEAEKLEGKKIGSRQIAAEAAEGLEQKFSRRELLGQRLLSAAVARNDFAILDGLASCLGASCQRIYEILKKGERKATNPAEDELINLIVLRGESLIDSEIEELKSYLKREYCKDRRRELTALVREAEASGDEIKLQSALEEVNNLPVF
jgi:DNA primase